MVEKLHCPRCKVELSGDAPLGLCPECLYQQAVEGPRADAEDEVKRSPSPSFVPPTALELARYFPQLEILELLGQGGMGAVYKARQRKLDRLVAVKILPPEVARDPAFAERFAREARSLAHLNHPNIVTIFDFGEIDGLYYFSMEYVDGKNVRELLNAGALPPQTALKIVPQVCDALQYAHDEGIVHRDIKPENILVDKKGRVKIADFGLARLVGLTPTYLTLTGSHEVMGTLYYMAPEQMKRTHSVDHRADLYSLGVVFYEMLTGEIPVGRFAPPSHKARVDGRLDPVVLRALAREPGDRYQDAGQMKRDVESVAAGGSAQAAADASRAEAARAKGGWPTVRFSIRHINWWGGRARGEMYRDDQCLILEFQIETMWGGRSEFKEVKIPLAEIVSISCQTPSWPGANDVIMGVHFGGHINFGKHKKRQQKWSKWLPTEIVLKVARPSLLAELPVGHSGRGRLSVAWGDQAAARELVESITQPSARTDGNGGHGRDNQGLPKHPPDPRQVRLEVVPPAVGLALTALLAVLSSVGLAIWGLDRIHEVAWTSRNELLTVMAGVLTLLMVATAVGYLFVGALQMMKLGSYPFALAAGILAVIPWSPAWIMGLPFGIWALVILQKPDVIAAFREQQYGPRQETDGAGMLVSFLKSFGGYFLPTFARQHAPSNPRARNMETRDHVVNEPQAKAEGGNGGAAMQ
jgi:tRNA A-37 threonylcarbamoyl transferase component Bud32